MSGPSRLLAAQVWALSRMNFRDLVEQVLS